MSTHDERPRKVGKTAELELRRRLGVLIDSAVADRSCGTCRGAAYVLVQDAKGQWWSTACLNCGEGIRVAQRAVEDQLDAEGEARRQADFDRRIVEQFRQEGALEGDRSDLDRLPARDWRSAGAGDDT